MRLTHAANLNIGSSLSGLRGRPGGEANGFATAVSDTFRTVVDHALANEANFIVIAGDGFDGDWADHITGLFFFNYLADLRSYPGRLM